MTDYLLANLTPPYKASVNHEASCFLFRIASFGYLQNISPPMCLKYDHHCWLAVCGSTPFYREACTHNITSTSARKVAVIDHQQCMTSSCWVRCKRNSISFGLFPISTRDLTRCHLESISAFGSMASRPPWGIGMRKRHSYITYKGQKEKWCWNG